MKLDAFVYPTWSNPPRLIGDLNTPHGDNSQVFSPTTGLPGDQRADGLHARGTLPAGMTFFGRAWSEATLIKLAYAYEQATRHRHPPALDSARETLPKYLTGEKEIKRSGGIQSGQTLLNSCDLRTPVPRRAIRIPVLPGA